MQLKLTTQRRLAAKILKCGESRIWIDPSRLDEVKEAITTGDVRKLIKMKAIAERPEKGTSRARAKVIARQKSKGKRKGQGKRKGKRGARNPRKKAWISTIRSLRKEIRLLVEKDMLDRKDYRKLYIMAKSGVFRSKSHLHLFLKEREMLKEGKEK